MYRALSLLAVVALTACGSAMANGEETPAGLVPIGTVLTYAGNTPPTGWLVCDGAEVDRAQYPDLFYAIGIAHGHGDGVRTFHLPDYRGRFLRGVDRGAKRDPEVAGRAAANLGGNTGDKVGSVQTGATALPAKPFVTEGTLNVVQTGINYYLQQGSGYFAGQSGRAVATGGDAETRPANAAVLYIIRAQ